MDIEKSKFSLGDIVRHKYLGFRGVVFDIDPVFSNTEEWYESIPYEFRPRKDQPFYHLFAENETSYYVAYVSEQNLEHDAESGAVNHPEIQTLFEDISDGKYKISGSLN